MSHCPSAVPDRPFPGHRAYAADVVPLDPQITVRPWSHAIADQDPVAAAWQAHLDAGRIGGNPPDPPAVVAQRTVNDALFRGFARDRHRCAHAGL